MNVSLTRLRCMKPEYDIATGQFLGLYERVGFIIVRGDSGYAFFNYGYDKEKSKLLDS